MPKLTVLGIGNPILADDGIGLAILEQVQKAGPPPGRYGDTELCYVDGGISGIEILPDIQDADQLLILDAVAGPGKPGQVEVFEGEQIPYLLQAKLSPHQVGLLDLLAMARLLGQEPEKIAVVGVIADYVGVKVGLSSAVVESIPQATSVALDLLQKWLQDSTSTQAISNSVP